LSNAVSFSLQGKVAIITGGSETIGRGIALEYARSGARVVVAARTQSKLDEVKATIESEGGTCLTIPTNIRDSKQLEAMIDQTVDHFGRLDILVNNAGGAVGDDFKRAPLLELTDQDIMGCFDLNVKSLIRASALAVPKMQAQGGGTIINMGSMGGVGRGWGGWGPAHMTVYNMTKDAVIHLTKAMATQWAPLVRVNCINPGFIDSPVIREGRSEETLDAIRMTIGVERYGTPQDVANAAVYLASDAATWVNGTALDIFGGAKWG
jgi:NAD(P)-dependent dehydrogenase (short-subunit alcohol dehydrogenase family)